MFISRRVVMASVALLIGAPLVLRGQVVASPSFVRGARDSSLPFDLRDRQSLDIRVAEDGSMETDVLLGGVRCTVHFVPFDLRSREFNVVLIGADGAMRSVPFARSKTYRGLVVGYPDSFATATWIGGMLSARIELPGGRIWQITPLPGEKGSLAGAPFYGVYESSGIWPPAFSCGCDADSITLPPTGSIGSTAATVGPARVVEIAFDADHEFFQQNGSSVARTVADIEVVMNDVSAIYEALAGVSYEITTIVVRTAEPDPYTSTNNRTLLDEFAAEWNANMGHIPRDIAHLMTGKTMDGGVIGSANIDTVCDVCGDAMGYGFSQSRFSLVPAFRSCLTAHELGHNWGAVHCDGESDCATMCSEIGACGGNCGQFGISASSAIITGVNTAPCVSTLPPPLELPFCETFDAVISPDRWTYLFGSTVVSGELLAPSPPFVLELNACCGGCNASPAADEIRSNVIHLGAADQASLNYHVRFAGNPTLASANLAIEYAGVDGGWKLIESLEPSDPALASYSFRSNVLPPGALHDEFRFRFRVTEIDPQARWLVDDVTVGSTTGNQPILFVRSDATPGGDGATWADAFANLQDALGAAKCSLGVVKEIWVAQGVYTPDRGTGNRTASFVLLNGVEVLGGFRGDEVDRDDRNPELYSSVLSGEIGDPSTVSDNSFHVVSAGGLDPSAVLDGFVISDGNANAAPPDDAGAGLFMAPGSPTIRRCRIVNNSALRGAGMFVQIGGAPKIDSTTFRDNWTTTGSGGAVGVDLGSTPTFDRCIFGGNFAPDSGGALWVANSLAMVTNSVFSGNRSTVGGAVAASGSTLVFENTTFASNQASADHGGLWATGSNATLSSTIFWENSDSIGMTESSQLGGNTIVIHDSTVQGWSGSLGGTGNDGDDPRFRDGVGPDQVAGTIDDNLRLFADSPAINAGDSSRIVVIGESDIIGVPRVLCGRVDRGAYEFGLGDSDCDGLFTGDDLNAGFSTCVSGPGVIVSDFACLVFDSDADGDVDLTDFSTLNVVFSGGGL